MKKLEFIQGNNKLTFQMDKLKIILGNNYLKKFLIYQCINGLNRNKESEYQIEENKKAFVKINEKMLTSKSVEFIFVNQFFDFDQEFKLGSKSLLLKYLTKKLESKEFFDEINTINTLVSTIHIQGHEIDDCLYYKFNDWLVKSLLKELSIVPIKNECEAFCEDLDFNEVIILQLKIIDAYLSYCINEDIFVVLDIPILTNEIYDYLTVMNYGKVIILLNEIDVNVNMDEVVICNNEVLDLADEESLFLIVNNIINDYKSLEEIKVIMKDYLNKKCTDDLCRKLDKI